MQRLPPIRMKLIDIILSLFIPPLAVLLRKGPGKDFLINLLLWVLIFYIGGIIHAFWVLTRESSKPV